MTEDHSELNLCPLCGKENLPMATRCVHCGAEMESLFTISGQTQLPDGEPEDSLPDIIEEIRNDPALQTPKAIEPNPEQQPADQIDESVLDREQLPDWLIKVRERAQEEEDAIGDLASGTIAMDAARSEEASAGVEGEFNAWINRIREKSQQENSIRARQVPNQNQDPDQVPEWLQRIRALRPQPEEDITHEVKTSPAYLDDLPREWTDEALDELRRQALAEDFEQETEPISDSKPQSDVELSAAPAMEAPGESPVEGQEQIGEDFHNMPDDEDGNSEPISEEDLSLSLEAENEIAAEETLETEAIHAVEEEPDAQAEEALEETGENLPELDNTQPEEAETIEDEAKQVAPEGDLVELETSESPEQSEPESAALEDEAKPLPQETEAELEEEQPSDSAAVPPDLLLLRDQQDRANLLAALIEEEGRVTAGKQPSRKPSGRAGRLAVALLLLLGLIVSILIGPAALPPESSKSLAALALDDRIQEFAEGTKVLVVLDYQAAASRELESLAAPLLGQLHSQNIQLEFLTTQPSGLFLAESLFKQAGLPEHTRVTFLPGSYLSLISSAASVPIADAGDGVVKELHSFKLVLLVSDSSDNIRAWLEQIAPWNPTTQFGAVTTQMEAPLLSPYFDSGQLAGYAAGIAEGNISSQTTFNYRAYRVGLLLMLVMLLLGMISKGEADAIRREEERAE